MNKRKAGREQRKAQKTEAEAALTARIAAAILAGQTLPGLRDEFSGTVLKRAFCRFAVDAPGLLDRVLGTPPSGGKILIDECADPALLPDLHRLFGRAVFAPALFGKSVRDDALFAQAAAAQFTAIVTCDGVSAGPRDLCGIARNAYDSGTAQAPHVILVPQKAEDALAALRQNAPAIRALLAADTGRILTLDPARKTGRGLA